MNKFLYIILLLTIAFFSNAQSNWVSFDNSKSKTPAIEIIQQDDNKLTLSITIPGVLISSIEREGYIFQKLEIEQNKSTKEVGMPELPMINEMIGIPSDKIARVTIADVETLLLEDYLVFPFQTPTKDFPQQQVEKFAMDIAFYTSNEDFPQNQVYLSKPGYWRDIKVASLHIVPFNYDPLAKKLEVYKKMQIEIEFTSVNDTPEKKKKKSISPRYYRMYESAILNFNSLGYISSKSVANGIKYLIITDTSAVNSLQPFVDWKNQQGYKVEVKTLDNGFNTPAEFKNYITNLYESDGLEYILMVGDAYPLGGNSGEAKDIPMYWWSPAGEDPTYSDSWYTCINGPDDHYADIAVGRITYDNLAELETQIQKTLDFYLNPDTTSNWPENSLLIAHKEEYPEKYTQCSEEIRLYPYSLQTPEFEKAYGGESYSNELVVDYINTSACGILNYRGHGSDTELWEWCPQGSFTSSHVNSLNNDDRLFVFFDVCCNNMNIVGYDGNSLCESFMKSTAAAVAANGAIIPSYTIPNHDYNKEMFKALFDLGITNIGYISNYANISVLNDHGDIGRSNVRTYLWLGDASLEPWTSKPNTMTVSYDEILFLGSINYSATVTSNGNPVANAMVCVSGDDLTLYGVAYTDEYGNAEISFDLPVQNPGVALLTVTSHNFLPFQEEIQTIPQDGPYVICESFSLNDNITGNGDGRMDFGETLLLGLTVKNIGIMKAGNVTVTLSSASPYISFDDSTEYYGQIESNGQVEMEDAFALSVSEYIPDGQYVFIDMKATASDEQIWYSNFYIEAHAAILKMESYAVIDPEGNNNGIIDPGETVNLSIGFKNSGSSTASLIIADLETDDPFISIITESVNIGILNSDSVTNKEFSIIAGENTPVGHIAELNITMSSDPGISSTESITEMIGRVPVLVLDLDSNNSSGPVMINILEDLGIVADYNTNIPENLNLYTSVFVCLGVFDENHKLSEDEGQILFEYLYHGGSLYMEGGDTWAYDESTAVHPMFNIEGSTDGSSDMGSIYGVQGSFTENMIFNYLGENNFMDHINPIYPAFTILENNSPTYGTAVAFDNGTYKTIAASHEFGGLEDDAPVSTKERLMIKYLQFFGVVSQDLNIDLQSSQTTICEGETISFANNSSGNNLIWDWEFEGGDPPASQEENPMVIYYKTGVYDVSLTVSDGINSLSHMHEDIVHVQPMIDTPGMPSGLAEVCTNFSQLTTYTSNVAGDNESLEWTLQPSEAGTISSEGIYATIEWTENWTGEASLKVKRVSENCESEFSEKLIISCSVCTGIKEPEEIKGVKIYPNPSAGIFKVKYDNGYPETEILVLNVLNKKIFENTFTENNEQEISINLSSFDKGLYFVIVKSGSEQYVEKIVIQ